MDNFLEQLFNHIKVIIEWILNIFIIFFSNLWDFIKYLWIQFINNPVAFIFLIVFIYLIIRIIIDLVREAILKKKLDDTKMDVKYEFGYTIYIFGKIRTGKTTLMCALQNVLTEVLQSLACQEITKTKEIITEANWEKVDSTCAALYAKRVGFRQATKYLITRYPQWLTGSYFDKINLTVSYEKLVENYVEASFALLENNYVISPKSTPIFNRITNTFSKEYCFDSLKLKEAFDNKKFTLSRYKTICFDEKGLDQDKKNTSTMANASVDDGYNEALKIFGNAGKEVMYLITTNQDFAQYLKSERSLMMSNVEVLGNRVYSRWKVLNSFLDHLRNIVNFNYTVSKFFHFGKLNRNSFIISNNIYKRQLRWIALRKKDLYSKSIIQYKCRLYADANCIGKQNTSTETYYEELNLYFPITYAFGNIDSHIYSFIFDELMDNSLINYYEVDENKKDLSPEDKVELVKNMLDREEKALNKKRNKENLDQETKVYSAFDFKEKKEEGEK